MVTMRGGPPAVWRCNTKLFTCKYLSKEEEEEEEEEEEAKKEANI